MNYYQDDNPFLEPSVHNLGTDGTGKTVSDFPLIYYLVAQIWKITGVHPFIYRLIVLLFFFSGLFALFKGLEHMLKDSILAITSSLYLFTSPVLVYYGNNFLMNMPAFSLALLGLYFFYRFSLSSSGKYLYLFSFCFALAGLLKIPSLLCFIAILGIYFLELVNLKPLKDKKIFNSPLKQLIPLLSVLLIQIVWYLYAHGFNEKHNEGFFLIGILPIWDMNVDQIRNALPAIGDHIKWDYFRIETQLVLLLMFIAVVVHFKRINRRLLALLILNSFGFLIFIILFFQAVEGHDYYIINLFILVPLIFINFLQLLKDRYGKIYNSLFFKIIIIAFLAHNVDFTRRRMDSRYKPDGWSNKYYFRKYQSLLEVTPYLRSVGIEKDDRILSLSDGSINISLYLMNQKGWTNYGIHGDSLKIDEKIKMGAKYLIIFDETTYKDPGVKPWVKNKIGGYHNIDIFALGTE